MYLVIGKSAGGKSSIESYFGTQALQLAHMNTVSYPLWKLNLKYLISSHPERCSKHVGVLSSDIKLFQSFLLRLQSQ